MLDFAVWIGVEENLTAVPVALSDIRHVKDPRSMPAASYLDKAQFRRKFRGKICGDM